MLSSFFAKCVFWNAKFITRLIPLDNTKDGKGLMKYKA